MKKLIILFCGTLALAACGNGLEKKANEKLMVAKAAYERGDYEEAKLQKHSKKRLLIWIAPFRQKRKNSTPSKTNSH